MSVYFAYNKLYRRAYKPMYYKKYNYKLRTNIIRGIVKKDIEIYENWEYVKDKMYINIDILTKEVLEKQSIKVIERW